MSNRTTVKNDVSTNIVPVMVTSVHRAMLNEICDNVKFKEDVAVIQSSSVTSITVDFTGKDRIDLTRTGGSLAITASGISDGDTVFLLITKTAGQAVSFVGITDVTPVKAYVTALGIVLYEIIRKGSNYFAKAWVESVKQATDTITGTLVIASTSEHNALSSTSKAVVPGRIPISSTTQRGLIELETMAETLAGTGTNRAVSGVGVAAVINNTIALPAWQTMSLASGWQGTVRYFKDVLGNTHLQAVNLLRTTSFSGNDNNSVTFGGLSSGYIPQYETHFVINSMISNNRDLHVLKVGANFLAISPDPDDYIANATINFYIIFRHF
jgi:hypothetical protein